MPSSQLDVQKRQHRERAQPLHRQRLGLLEKHKDYVQRARDYHSKQDRIKALQEKAEGRNRDEFYFGMVKSRTKGGVHIASRGNEALPVDIVKLLKTQDVKYVQLQKVAEQKRIAKLKEQLETGLAEERENEDRDVGPSQRGRRTVFTDDPAAVRSAAPLKTRTKLGAKLRPRGPLSAGAKAHRERLQAEIAARTERANTLARAEREIELQRLMMGKGAKQDILGKRKRRKDAPERTEGDEESDEEFRSGAGSKSKLPHAEEGVKTGARVWRWKAGRKR